MKEVTVILRFRDLVTGSGGTIEEHQAIVNRHDVVWWGWWKRQTELPVNELFEKLHNRIQERGTPLPAFVFDTGAERLYLTSIQSIAVAPEGSTITTPDPARSPTYYQQGEYPAWFLLTGFQERSLSSIVISHHSFPTNPELETERPDLKGQVIRKAKDLRRMDVTLYVVTVDEESL